MSLFPYHVSRDANGAYAILLALSIATCLLPGSCLRIRRELPFPFLDEDVDESLITVPQSCYNEPMTFDEFRKTYGRTYEPGSAEYLFRKGLFELHTAAAQMQNCKLNSKWTAGVNAHADWTEDELASLRGYVRSGRPRGQLSSAGPRPGRSPAFLLQRQEDRLGPESHELEDLESYPEAVTWGHLASIRTPRDQGQCGSCWAYAAETAMRAHAEISGLSHNFSVDELISCVPNPQECGGQGGCQGATIELAFDYVMRTGLAVQDGLSAEDSSSAQVACPFEDGLGFPVKEVILNDGQEVHMQALGSQELQASRGARLNMFGWSKLPENREEPLIRALVEMGPLAVAVAAGWQWNLYKAGIMATDDSCQDQVITHAVVLFGYGVEDGTRFWHLKNSWGSWWGEDGNMRLQRLDQEEQVCDWDTKPEVGTGCLGGPPQVWVCGSCGILYDVSIPHFRPMQPWLEASGTS